MPNRKAKSILTSAYSELFNVIQDDWSYEGTLTELKDPKLTWSDINAESTDISEIMGEVCDSLHIVKPAITYKITDTIYSTLSSLQGNSKAA